MAVSSSSGPGNENNPICLTVRSISPLVGDADISIEVFADVNSLAEDMFAEGKEMFSWILNAYNKFPCTHEGLRAAVAV